MARKRKSTRRRRRSSALSAAPAPRRRRKLLSSGRTRRRRNKRKGFLHDGPTLPVIGKVGLGNPLIGGGTGGVAAMIIKKMIPESMIPASMAPYKKYLKGALLLVGAFAAKKMKQDMIAAGLSGAAVVLTMTELGMLADGPFKSAKFANANLLSNNGINMLYDEATGSMYELSPAEASALRDSRLLSDGRLLSNNSMNPYANYQAR